MAQLSTNELVAALLRTNFEAFVEFAFAELHPRATLLRNWHIDLLAEHCDVISRNEPTKLIINLPPRYLKSEIVSVALPAFMIGRDPTKQILIVAGSKRLAADLMENLKRLVTTPRYRSLFSQTIIRFDAASIRTQHGGRIAFTTVGSQLSGLGADLIIVDDPLSPSYAQEQARREEVNGWFDAEVVTRINSRWNGSLVILMQRVHRDDLCGHLLSSAAASDFVHVRLPAVVSADVEVRFPSGRIYLRRAYEPLQPARESLSHLETRLDEIGGFNFIGQYLQGDFRLWPDSDLRSEFLYSKRPEAWVPGDPMCQSVWAKLDVKDDVKAAFFGGYSIYDDFQHTKWMTQSEFVAGAVIQQRRLVEEASGTRGVPKNGGSKLTDKQRNQVAHIERGMTWLMQRNAIHWAPL